MKMNINKVTIFDTSIATSNLGDEIIVDGVREQINNIYNSDTMFFKVPTHEKIGLRSYTVLNDSDQAFVAGTNLLNSIYRPFLPRQWRLNLYDLNFIRSTDIILMGVGWIQYQNEPNYFAKKFYKKALSKKYIHSVRDSYTEKKLKSIGINNVINTSCATMWNLTPEHCATIPKEKAKNVVFTLTDYRRDEKNDQKLINLLEDIYNDVYFWPQGANDIEYINKLNIKKVKFVNPTLKAYDDLLKTDIDIEYVGTRLHGGVRALQNKKRTLIIGVDNRALEKKKDFNLNVLDKKNIDDLSETLMNSFETNIKLDFNKIDKWKKQFM